MPWPPRRENKGDEFDITRAEAEAVRQRLPGKPVSVLHDELETEVGRVEYGYWDTEGNLCVEFTLHDSSTGKLMHGDILRGIKRGLSLQHNWQTCEVAEVSLCDIPARWGSGITGQMQQDGDKRTFIPLPACAPLPGMSSVARDPNTGQFMSAATPAPAAGTPAPPAAAAPTGVAPMDTSAAAPGSSGPVDDPLQAMLANPAIPIEQRKQLLADLKAREAARMESEAKLQEANAKLAASKRQEQDLMRIYLNSVSRLITMGGQDTTAVNPEIEKAMEKNDLAGLATATADVMVKASASIERALEQNKRKAATDDTTTALLQDYQMFNRMLKRPAPAHAAEAAALAASSQFAQPMVQAALPLSSGASAAHAPPTQQHAPAMQQQNMPRDGSALIPPELRAVWNGYMATNDQTVDISGTLQRAGGLI